MNPLPGEPVLYEGPNNDWVLAPVTTADDAVVPPRERRELSRLIEGIDFPLLYIAHEVRKEQTRALLEQRADHGPLVLDRASAGKLVGPVPPPGATLALGDRLSRRSSQLLRAAANTSKVIGLAAVSVAAAPVVLVGGASRAWPRSTRSCSVQSRPSRRALASRQRGSCLPAGTGEDAARPPA